MFVEPLKKTYVESRVTLVHFANILTRSKDFLPSSFTRSFQANLDPIVGKSREDLLALEDYLVKIPAECHIFKIMQRHRRLSYVIFICS